MKLRPAASCRRLTLTHREVLMIFFKLTAAAVLSAAAFVIPAHAEDWKPSGPVTLIVPSTPGGGHDTNARALSKVMEKHDGQPIVIINQPAGGGGVAYNKR